MEIRRTANAGVLLRMDGVSIALDGVCLASHGYLPTPDAIREELTQCPPDVLAYTHCHPDHFDGDYAQQYVIRTHRPVIGPVGLPVSRVFFQPVTVGGVTVTPIPSRHMGKADCPHVSFLIRGSETVFFTGDASPVFWRGQGLPKADFLLATYGFGISQTGWKMAKTADPAAVVFLHLPAREQDEFHLWEGLCQVTGGDPSVFRYIPQMGERLVLTK